MRALLTGAALMFSLSLAACGGPLGPECKKLQDEVKKTCATPNEITKEMCADENIKKLQTTTTAIGDMTEEKCKETTGLFTQLNSMMGGDPAAPGAAPSAPAAPAEPGSAPADAPK